MLLSFVNNTSLDSIKNRYPCISYYGVIIFTCITLQLPNTILRKWRSSLLKYTTWKKRTDFLGSHYYFKMTKNSNISLKRKCLNFFTYKNKKIFDSFTLNIELRGFELFLIVGVINFAISFSKTSK